MKRFENGVQRFIHGEVRISVNFPVDWNGRESVCCTQCPFLSSNERMCQLNKKPVQYPQKYVGYHCPLEFAEEANT